jgi:Do/DeqQ family serine protease
MRLTTVLLLPLALLAACSDPTSRSSAAPATFDGPAPALAQPNRAPPADFATMKMSFAPIVKRAAPAVVNVFSQRVVRQQIDPFFQQFLGLGAPQARVEGSLGSGVIVRADGLIVTNNHVIEGGQQLNVVLSDRREFPAKVVLADARSDLAVLKIDVGAEKLPVLPIADRDEVQVGDLVLAIGDPFGVGQTVTNGIVSALARTDVGASDFSFFIQTDAAINPGNSGGPMVDMNGNLIGLNTLIYSRTGSSSGLGFAIPAAMVRRVVESASGGRTSVTRAWLGARTQAVDTETAKSLGLDRPGGLLVSAIYPGGPAAEAGLKQGDMILSADGQPVNDEASLSYRVATKKPGERIVLSVRQGGATRTLNVLLVTPPGGAPDPKTLQGRQPLGGATVATLTPALGESVGVNGFLTGVLVLDPGQGIAARVGFEKGDVVLEINGRPVRNASALTQQLSGATSWHMVIDRGGKRIPVDF